jgi:uncharacterized protein (DUF983 family)
MSTQIILQKLQQRWGVNSIWQVCVIFVVFGLTGISAAAIKKPIFQWLEIDETTPIWLRILVWIVTVLPTYQVLLLLYGFLLGQFTFFWNFEKRTFGRILSLFQKRKG